MLYDKSCCPVQVKYYCFVTLSCTTRLRALQDRSVQPIWATQEHASPHLAHLWFNACSSTGLWSVTLTQRQCWHFPANSTDILLAAALLRLCWIGSFSWLPKPCAGSFIFSPHHLPRVETIPAALNPCVWWRKLWAVCAITTPPSCCSAALLPVTLG